MCRDRIEQHLPLTILKLLNMIYVKRLTNIWHVQNV